MQTQSTHFITIMMERWTIENMHHIHVYMAISHASHAHDARASENKPRHSKRARPAGRGTRVAAGAVLASSRSEPR